MNWRRLLFLFLWTCSQTQVTAQSSGDLPLIGVLRLDTPESGSRSSGDKGSPILANDLESDPIASGYVASLARPEGNLTGLFLDAPTLCGKWLQQINEIVPNLRRIAILWMQRLARISSMP